MTREPVVIGNAIGALVPLITGVTAAFGVWRPTDDQLGAITALYAGVLAVATLLTRNRVQPV